MDIKFPIYSPYLEGNERKYVDDCIQSTWISSKGKYIRLFEEKFSQYTGIPYSSVVSNGTVALHLALLALGIGSGDEVIVPSFTYVASVNAISYVGGTPIFVDSLPDSWQINHNKIEECISKNTKAILAVHLYGGVCDMDAINKIAKKYNLYIIEDCAEAIGALYNDKHVGQWGDVATFSFFGNKTITTGEGGMVCSGSNEIIKRVNKLKGQAVSSELTYWHDEVGYNYRMTNICAAIGVAQLENIEAIIEKKKKIFDMFYERLDKHFFRFPEFSEKVKPGNWLVTTSVSDESCRNELFAYLNKFGIETRPSFHLVHEMPMYRIHQHNYDLPVARMLSVCGLNLPSYPGLELNEVEQLCDILNSFFKDRQ